MASAGCGVSFGDVDGDERPGYDEDEKSDGEYCTEGVHGVSFLEVLEKEKKPRP